MAQDVILTDGGFQRPEKDTLGGFPPLSSLGDLSTHTIWGPFLGELVKIVFYFYTNGT